jgi:cell division protein FtsW
MSAISKHIRGDRVIWMVIILLSMISILAVYSSTGSLAYKVRGGNTGYYLIKQLIFLAIGVFIIIATSAVPYKYYSRMAQIFLIIAVPVLALTLVTGPSINEARRWLTLFQEQVLQFSPLILQSLQSLCMWHEYYPCGRTR